MAEQFAVDWLRITYLSIHPSSLSLSLFIYRAADVFIIAAAAAAAAA